MIQIVTTEDTLRRCYRVIRQLRPHLDSVERFVQQVERQHREQGYEIAFREDDHGNVAAVAGYRIFECLAWGRTLYVDDLVTDTEVRSAGHGRALLRWLTETARAANCDQLHLDSGVQRFGAHRFYLRHGFDITSHHFAQEL